MKKWWNWIVGALLLILLLFAISLKLGKDRNQLLRPVFEEYVKLHNKSYKSDPVEYETRFQHFMESFDEIERLNAESRGPDDYRARYGLTFLSDMSKNEFSNIHLSDEKIRMPSNQHPNEWSKDKEYNQDIGKGYFRKKRVSLPLRVDWREKGVIGSVHYQGICGACWAFSTVGTMEAMAAIATGKLQELSVQEMVDCARLGNSGCSGGDICLLLNWLSMTSTPAVSEAEYPLRLTDGACRLTNGSTAGVKLKSYTCINMVGNEQKLLQSIATHGPVAIAVNAFTWQNYLGGVIQYHCSGSPSDLNHAVQLVGYNIDSEVPYYIAKNSWGKEFGDDGYLKLAIGNNICGLANEVASIDVSV